MVRPLVAHSQGCDLYMESPEGSLIFEAAHTHICHHALTSPVPCLRETYFSQGNSAGSYPQTYSLLE